MGGVPLSIVLFPGIYIQRFCTSKKGGIGGGGRVSAWGAVYMAAALASYRKALIGTGLAISLLFDTNGHR